MKKAFQKYLLKLTERFFYFAQVIKAGGMRSRITFRLNWIVIPILCSVTLLLSCKTNQQTAWLKTKTIRINGISDDWQGKLASIYDQKFLIGFQHDNQFLYMCLISNDQRIIRQVILQGLILWFNAEKDKIGKIGIKYPLGLRESGMLAPDLLQNDGMISNNRPQWVLIFENALGEIEFQLPSDDTFQSCYLSQLDTTNFEIKLTHENENFIYEMKIPLKKKDLCPFAVSRGNVQAFTMKIQTPKMNHEFMHRS